MAAHRVVFVPDEVLDGRDFVLCNDHGDGVALYIRRGVRTLPEADSEAIWENAWTAYRELAHIDEIPTQRQRNADLAKLLGTVATQ